MFHDNRCNDCLRVSDIAEVVDRLNYLGNLTHNGIRSESEVLKESWMGSPIKKKVLVGFADI